MKAICQKKDCKVEIEVLMCCSGTDCGCLGQPTEPPLCWEHYNEYELGNLPYLEFLNKTK